MNYDVLPVWEELDRKAASYSLDPLERFVYAHEPVVGSKVLFREMLQSAIDFCSSSGRWVQRHRPPSFKKGVDNWLGPDDEIN
jgi:hypothetical protein